MEAHCEKRRCSEDCDGQNTALPYRRTLKRRGQPGCLVSIRTAFPMSEHRPYLRATHTLMPKGDFGLGLKLKGSQTVPSWNHLARWVSEMSDLRELSTSQDCDEIP
jgi:hypothetical protein